MKYYQDTTKHTESFTLGKGALIRLESCDSAEITVTHGCLWLTREADNRDLLLFSGQHHCLGRTGKILASARCDSDIIVAFQPLQRATGRQIHRVDGWSSREARRRGVREPVTPKSRVRGVIADWLGAGPHPSGAGG